MESDDKEIKVTENFEKTGEKTIKLKDHQVELFEKCKYTGTERTPKNKENDCSVMDIEGETNLAEQYKKEIEFLKKTIERQASQIIDLQKKLDEQAANCNEESVENTTKKRKIRDVESLINATMIADSANKDIEITTLEEENKKMKMKIAEFEASEEIDKRPMKTTNEKMMKSIEDRLSEGIASIKTELEKILLKRIDDHIIQNSSSHNQSYAAALQKAEQQQDAPTVTSFREIARIAKMEELEEENQKRLRKNNIIIHGKKETNVQSGGEEDSLFVKEMIKELCIGAVTAKSMERIGNSDTEKVRPLKVIFMNESDKNKVMGNLKNLKDKPEYNGISIKEDFTISERSMIKEFVKRANEKNEKEPSDSEYVWRVRGSPKNRLFLKKVMRVNQKI